MKGESSVFADILLPVPVPGLFTYRLPPELVAVATDGKRAIVPFGQKKILTGIITGIHRQPPVAYVAKEVIDVPDSAPVVVPQQLRLFRWMAGYYMCTQGEVLNAALPSGLKISSRSMVQLHPDLVPDGEKDSYSATEWKVIEALGEKEHLSYDQIAQITGLKNVYHLIRSLYFKGAILLFEQLVEKYKPKKERRMRLAQRLAENMPELEAVFTQLEKKEKQLAVLMRYLSEMPMNKLPLRNEAGIARTVLAVGLSASAMATLVRHGVMEEFDREVSRLGEPDDSTPAAPELTPLQEQKMVEILGLLEKVPVVLLHGVTGSGKTEVYIRLLLQVVEEGGQALYLLPEIALTTQILRRLKRVFGDRIGVLSLPSTLTTNG